jgi:hypothetical protein
MENNSSETLYRATISSETISLNSSRENHSSYCFNSEKWCFKHSGIAGFKYYDETAMNCFVCLDCCTWCLEFRFKRLPICSKEMNCYICCCAIYFG